MAQRFIFEPLACFHWEGGRQKYIKGYEKFKNDPFAIRIWHRMSMPVF
jgi:hypothetical protein